MNNTLKTKLLTQIDRFLDIAEEVRATHEPNPPNFIGFPTLAETDFVAWKSGVENLIIKIDSNVGVFYKNFTEKVKRAHIGELESGIGVLKSLKNALEQDLLGEIEDLVRAEVFTDFLEMAQHLLEAGYKDPAATLVGGVLENGLRKIAEKHNVAVKDKDDISSLNTKLGDARAYGPLDRSQIQTWKKLRDSAAHGNYDEYTKPKVEAMLEGVRRFLAEHLG